MNHGQLAANNAAQERQLQVGRTHVYVEEILQRSVAKKAALPTFVLLSDHRETAGRVPFLPHSIFAQVYSYLGAVLLLLPDFAVLLLDSTVKRGIVNKMTSGRWLSL